MTHFACGLDFGTSNSTVGVVRDGQPTLLPLEDGKITIPSAIFFNTEDDVTSYGRAALTDYLSGYEGRLMRSLKSLLGSKLIDDQTEVQGRAMPFRELLAQFIGELKRRAETAAGRSFSRAVLGRPVFFVDGDPEADRRAEDTLAEVASAVGFHEIAFQYEPIAAAFDYEATINSEQLVLVADIGGGTSDFSVVRLSPERARKQDRREDILSNGGVHIGGTDFDKYLSLSSVMPLLGMGSKLRNGSEVPSSYYFDLATWHTVNQVYTRKVWQHLKDIYREAVDKPRLDRLQDLIRRRAGHWLALKVEEGKIALSGSEKAEIMLDRLAPPETLSLQRSDFNGAIAHLIESIERTVEGVIGAAGVAPERIETVFFTGGSSGVPILRERIAALVPGAQAAEGDAFGSIGAGLALDAARKFT
jgi:hypothetical chaperone protein